MKNQNIQAGETVCAVFPWREDETPSDQNFFTGKVMEVIIRSKNAVYVRVEGLSQIVPLDRIQIV